MKKVVHAQMPGSLPLAGIMAMASFPAAAQPQTRPVCTVPDKSPTGAIHITADCDDPLYREPYIDVNELRNDPVPHRYVHGGFRGTKAEFSFYFPPTLDRYRGRFFHHTYPLQRSSDIGPLPNNYDVAVGNLGFAMAEGAYYVQTNQGGDSDEARSGDPTIVAYRANAAAAKYSREVAASLFGPHRPFGYLYGASGGGFQTVGAAENTSGVWDGFVPLVMGTEHAIPSSFTVLQHTLRVLRRRDKLNDVVAAVSAGTDPYATLDKEEKAALREATLFGFPLQGWRDAHSIERDFFPNLAPFIPMLDPTYNSDFWTKPGYLGADPTSVVQGARFHFDTSVVRVIDGTPRRLVLASFPDKSFANAHLVLLQGPHAGKSIPIRDSGSDGSIGFALYADQALIDSLAAGDPVRIDNSWALAMETYHRHQVPPAEEGLIAWDQYRDASGQPIYPQRDVLIGPIISRRFAGAPMTGAIKGRMIIIGGTMDIDGHPWQTDWYRARVVRSLGAAARDRVAVRFIENGGHDNPTSVEAHAQIVSLNGHVEQALRDVAAWVEKGIRPAETRYRIVDTQIVLPDSAMERQGAQPLVALTARGQRQITVRRNAPVSFRAALNTPPGAGTITDVEWDFDGSGRFAAQSPECRSKAQAVCTATHRYERPGTYYAIVRVTAQRDLSSAYGRVQNLARMRVTVE